MNFSNMYVLGCSKLDLIYFQCYHVNGQCRCPGGWHGRQCDLPCPSGTFGPNCSHECYCHNEATCNPVDGRCKCKPGFTGTRCEEYCPEGYWGEDCYRACQCPNANFVCQPVHGCICRPGFTGKTNQKTTLLTSKKTLAKKVYNLCSVGVIKISWI